MFPRRPLPEPSYDRLVLGGAYHIGAVKIQPHSCWTLLRYGYPLQALQRLLGQ